MVEPHPGRPKKLPLSVLESPTCLLRVIMQPVWISAGKPGEKAAGSALKTTKGELSAHDEPGPSGS